MTGRVTRRRRMSRSDLCMGLTAARHAAVFLDLIFLLVRRPFNLVFALSFARADRFVFAFSRAFAGLVSWHRIDTEP